SLTNKERIGDELTTALEKNPDDAEYYCQRAYAHILLQKYADAVADAKKSLELNPNNAVALLRKGLGEYHIKNYASALESFREGQRLDSFWEGFCNRCIKVQNCLNMCVKVLSKYYMGFFTFFFFFFIKWGVFSCFLEVLHINGGKGVALNHRKASEQNWLLVYSWNFLLPGKDWSLERTCNLMGIETDKMDIYLTIHIT
uniref:Tetratricopeptide repeat protein n=1 Tax=Strix occidentalis caurina TaxID=311401 RepID=A0A8D0FTJ0_STROC